MEFEYICHINWTLVGYDNYHCWPIRISAKFCPKNKIVHKILYSSLDKIKIIWFFEIYLPNQLSFAFEHFWWSVMIYFVARAQDSNFLFDIWMNRRHFEKIYLPYFPIVCSNISILFNTIIKHTIGILKHIENYWKSLNIYYILPIHLIFIKKSNFLHVKSTNVDFMTYFVKYWFFVKTIFVCVVIIYTTSI